MDANVDPERGPDGEVSSDRSIKEYCDEIWKAHPLPVKLGKYTI